MGKLVESKKLAIIISYMMILANTFSNLILTPLYLRELGIELYGLYQMIYAVAHYILILDFGISTAMVRYITMYRENKDRRSEENFIAHCIGIVFVIVLMIIAIGIVLDCKLLSIYPTISDNESTVAHFIFRIMICTIAFSVVERFFQGIVMSYERFVIVNSVSLIKVALKTMVVVVLLVRGTGLVSIVAADLLVVLFAIAVLAMYSCKSIKFKARFTGFDKSLMIGVSTFMFALLLQSIVSYVNNVVDKTVLGIMTTKQAVAIYSVAMTFITLFNSLPSAITSVLLPQATRLVMNTEDRQKLTDYVVRPGRYQFMICGGIIAGFILFGKEFIFLWSGEDTVSAWIVALIIMIPNMIPLIENAVINILNAKNKRMFRSVALIFLSIANILISIILVRKCGMVGAPIGTALAYIAGYGIVLNIYYSRVIGINVIKMFTSIVSRIWICILISFIVCFPLNWFWNEYSWVKLLIKMVVFAAVFGCLLWIIGFNDQEKGDMNAILSRLNHKIKFSFRRK